MIVRLREERRYDLVNKALKGIVESTMLCWVYVVDVAGNLGAAFPATIIAKYDLEWQELKTSRERLVVPILASLDDRAVAFIWLTR